MKIKCAGFRADNLMELAYNVEDFINDSNLKEQDIIKLGYAIINYNYTVFMVYRDEEN